VHPVVDGRAAVEVRSVCASVPEAVMDSPVQVLNAAVTCSRAASAGTHRSRVATTSRVSMQNWPSMVEPKQITEPVGRSCIEVGTRCGPAICLQLLAVWRLVWAGLAVARWAPFCPGAVLPGRVRLGCPLAAGPRLW